MISTIDASHPVPLPQEPPPEGRPGLSRPLMATVRRHRLALMALLCGVASVVYLVTPMLGRSYRLSGTMEVSGLEGRELPGLEKLPERTAAEVAKALPAVEVHVQRQEKGLTLAVQTAAAARDSAQVQLMRFAQQFESQLKAAVEDRVAAELGQLRKQVTELTDKEEGLTREVAMFRATRRGVLPDDPTSVTAQYEKLAARLEEKEQRLRLVTGQLGRLEEYKKQRAKAADAAPPPPAPLPPPTAEAAAPVKPENDPEVVALTAQLQLLNEQVEEMLKTRTEQHPYVQDLRTQLAGVQKKLDAAKQRAAAGVPAPPTARRAPAAPMPSDPSLAAALQVDLQIESLRAEQSTLEGEVRTLTGQRDSLQKQVEQVGPARREFEEMTASREAARKGRQALKERLDRLGTLAEHDGMPVEVSPLALAQASGLPAFPRLSLVYPLGLLLGIAAAAGVAQLLHRADHRLHEVREVAATIDVPILGAVSEIRTPAQRLRRKAWRSVGRPLATVALGGLLLGSGLWCYQRLADGTPRAAAGLTSILHIVSERP